MAACEAVNRAGETSLREGVFVERHFSHGLLASRDQSEGVELSRKVSLSFDLGHVGGRSHQVRVQRWLLPFEQE
ncbi:hypothetical protein QFZ68_005273 [Streptomyces sp. V1I6]|nr:hypothetical protein [Streptomyces sp. V1I6]